MTDAGFTMTASRPRLRTASITSLWPSRLVVMYPKLRGQLKGVSSPEGEPSSLKPIAPTEETWTRRFTPNSRQASTMAFTPAHVDPFHDLRVEAPVRNEAGDVEDEIAATYRRPHRFAVAEIPAQDLHCAGEGIWQGLAGEEEDGDYIASDLVPRPRREEGRYEAAGRRIRWRRLRGYSPETSTSCIICRQRPDDQHAPRRESGEAMMRIGVTGAFGFLGANFIAALQARDRRTFFGGEEVEIVAFASRARSNPLFDASAVAIESLDILDRGGLQGKIRRPRRRGPFRREGRLSILREEGGLGGGTRWGSKRVFDAVLAAGVPSAPLRLLHLRVRRWNRGSRRGPG